MQNNKKSESEYEKNLKNLHPQVGYMYKIRRLNLEPHMLTDLLELQL